MAKISYADKIKNKNLKKFFNDEEEDKEEE